MLHVCTVGVNPAGQNLDQYEMKYVPHLQKYLSLPNKTNFHKNMWKIGFFWEGMRTWVHSSLHSIKIINFDHGKNNEIYTR